MGNVYDIPKLRENKTEAQDHKIVQPGSGRKTKAVSFGTALEPVKLVCSLVYTQCSAQKAEIRFMKFSEVKLS